MSLSRAQELTRAGRFADALAVLEHTTLPTADRVESEVLKTTLLERLGQHQRSRHMAEKSLRSRGLLPALRSDCHLTLALLDLDAGRTDQGVEHLRAALDLARQCKDWRRFCWAQLRLMMATCSTVDPQTSAQWISATRREVLRLGDGHVLIALHICVGELAIRHGALKTATRHALLALTLLESFPNSWLTAWARNNLIALSLIHCDIPTGLEHAVAGLAAAEASGGLMARRACLGNIGNLYILSGAWDQARQYLEQGLGDKSTGGEFSHAIVESIARMHLAQGDTSEAKACLDQIDSGVSSARDATLYAHRHSKLTRSRLLIRENALDQALEHSQEALRLAEVSGDRLLRLMSTLAQVEILSRQERWGELIILLDSLSASLPQMPPELLANYERVLGWSLRTAPTMAAAHFSRARRALTALGHRPGLLDLERNLGDISPTIGTDAPVGGDKVAQARVVQDVLALLLHVGRPELLAADVVEVLASTGCVARATAIARGDDGHVENLAAHAAPIGDRPATTLPSRTYLMGRARNRSVEVTCEPLHTVEAVATVNAVASLLDVVRDLDAARTEREERLGLWPADELPDADDDALITGAMRDVMRLARKVAPTNASVLITGESGTGKEIVARALHRFSNRAHAPFVPFNCNAVPKDLLESHLFGYRRGAFTGAERDHPGAVRTAKEGTLFLDEIGELGLELQPKLLRFLESGEIHPLGESEPIRVATRIVAATNANLDTLVQEGRFRTDLFYRLRVVPLWVPPLRERRDEVPFLARHFVTKAAAEYGKGHLQLSDETIELLVLYSWPGNVRQLNNELRRVVALADNDSTLTAEALSPEIRRGRPGVGIDDGAMTISLHETLATALGRVEREMITSALKTHQGRLDEAARALGISRKGLYLKRLRLGL